MIVKNEEDVIGRCLECVSDIFDEIIVVDTGSEDKTRDIVKKYTKNLYYFKWIEDFAAARNYAFSKATKSIFPPLFIIIILLIPILFNKIIN